MTQTKPRFSLSEDWLATLIGLAIVLVIGSGLLGPGPYSVTLTAKPGEPSTVDLPAGGGYQVTMDVTPAPEAQIFTTLRAGEIYSYGCQDERMWSQILTPDDLDTAKPPPPGHAQIRLDDFCHYEISLTYRHDPAIRWPLFNLFAR